jgi:hypothetical protein
MSTKIIGELSEEERIVIRERDRLVEQYKQAVSPVERRELLDRIDEIVARYDRMRRERWEAGEVR